jgi:pimeloyl-ACP methyl ester carboxylesterase
MNFKKLLLLITSFGLISVALSQETYKTIFIKGFSDNKLEVLDWGGKGTPILFVTGLGNSAHVYENFALKFTDKHHVFGITRRGFGKSERTESGFGTDTLVLDILRVLDKLSLNKVILVGHSIAGDELSTISRQYPKRVLATVYLDAAYNHSNLSVLGQTPISPNIPDTIPLTVESVSKSQKNEDGFTFPIGEWIATNNINANGILSEDTTSYYSFDAVLKGVKPISFKGTKCPSLAIYGRRETVFDRYKAYQRFDTANKRIAAEAILRWNKYYQTEIKNYKKECLNCKVEEIVGGHHYIFLSNPIQTETLIRQFLKTL